MKRQTKTIEKVEIEKIAPSYNTIIGVNNSGFWLRIDGGKEGTPGLYLALPDGRPLPKYEKNMKDLLGWRVCYSDLYNTKKEMEMAVAAKTVVQTQ